MDQEVRKQVDRYSQGIISTPEFFEMMVTQFDRLRGDFDLTDLVESLHPNQLTEFQMGVSEFPRTEEDWAAFRWEIVDEALALSLTWIEREKFCGDRQCQIYRFVIATRNFVWLTEVLPPGLEQQPLVHQLCGKVPEGQPSDRETKRLISNYGREIITDGEFFTHLDWIYAHSGESLNLSDVFSKLPSDKLARFKEQVDGSPVTEEDWAAIRFAFIAIEVSPELTFEERCNFLRELQRRHYRFIKAARLALQPA